MDGKKPVAGQKASLKIWPVSHKVVTAIKFVQWQVEKVKSLSLIVTITV